MPFFDLAGSHFVTLPSGLNTTQTELFLSSKENLWNSNQTSKLVFDNYEIDNIELIIDKIARDKKLHVEIKDYNSNFFALTRKEAAQWLTKNPFDGFEIEQITKNNKPDIEIVKNLLISSFAVKISKNSDGQTIFEPKEERENLILNNFDNVFDQAGLFTYLLKSETGQIVGSYSLYNVENEVQLSAVAGRTTLENGFKGKKLLPLCQAMIWSFLNEPKFATLDSLTLSNSKAPVAQLYSDLGYSKNSNRKGLLIRILD
jgi:hypothetical protein